MHGIKTSRLEIATRAQYRKTRAQVNFTGLQGMKTRGLAGAAAKHAIETASRVVSTSAQIGPTAL